MGGSSVVDDWVVPPSTPITLVLVGCTGNGKSATGNSILQKKAFMSKAQSSGVTQTCQMHTTVLKDGSMLNVIDTPGLFDCSVKTEFTAKEIAKCINMAKDGIDAVLVVLSVKSRFSEGEELVLNSLRTLFGNDLANYMIIVFTGGDDLEYDDKTLEDYLGQNCPKPLQKSPQEHFPLLKRWNRFASLNMISRFDTLDIYLMALSNISYLPPRTEEQNLSSNKLTIHELLFQCENRRVLFDNRTCDQEKKDKQVQELLSLVNLVVANNGGKPYTDELFVEWKKAEQIDEAPKQENDEQLLIRLTEMVELKFKESISKLEQQLAEERAKLEQQLAEEKAARLNAEKMMKVVEETSKDKIQKLKENLEGVERQLRDAAGRINCVIQ